MMAYLYTLLDRYRGLSLRERVLVSVTILAFTWGAWISSFGGMYIDDLERAKLSRQGVEQNLAAMSAEFANLQASKNNEHIRDLRKQRDQLVADIEVIERQAGELLGKFIGPEEVPDLLEDLLQKQPGLSLVSLTTLKSEKLSVTLQDADVVGDNVPLQTKTIYRHPFQLTFQGEFFAVLNYLQALEQGEWEIAWRELSYVVEDYPLALITLQIDTLSEDSEWVGV